jgi:hypothetical protein
MHRFLPALLLLPASAFAAGNLPTIGGIPVDFILFALTLLGVALFHHYTLYVALTGLFTISLYKISVHRLQDRRRHRRPGRPPRP